MAISWDSFDKIWASTSPLTPYEFSESNYQSGWDFIGSTPPSRQMWDFLQKQTDEKMKFLRDNFGTPNIVTQSSQMTDTNKIYVYIGSEAGWNNGHWYYWDGSAWADGGVYNATAFVTDTTLSIAGQPADAKATGDALALKADLAGCTFTGDVSVNADFTVTGETTLDDATVTDLTVTNINATDIVASNDATIGGNASVTGDISSANVTTTADGTIGGNLSVAGTTTLTGDVTASADLSVAGDSSLTNLSVSGTTALAGTSTAPTPSADDNSTKIATTEYVQTEIKPIETDVDIADKRITNIEKLLQGNLYDYQTDSSSAYIKSVPSGAMPYAGLEQIGGKTVVFTQYQKTLTVAPSTTISGITVSLSSDGALSITGTAGEDGTIVVSDNGVSIPANHRLMFTRTGTGDYAWGRVGFNPFNGGNTEKDYAFNSYNAAWTANIRIYIYSGVTYNITGAKFNICDMTLLFGSDYNPSQDQAYSDYRALFPADYYEYNEGELLSAGVTEVVSKDSNNATLQTIPIPASIQALEGYGWSAGDSYNYVDFERKVFVQNVARVDLGTVNYTYTSSSGFERFNAILSNMKKTGGNSILGNAICSKYPIDIWNQFGVNMGNFIAISGTASFNFAVRDINYTDATTFKTAMSGVYLYYELATPQETDISAYLTDDNLIQVEAGGTLTFQNQHGDDYRLPVPSDETYMIDLQEAINNG